MQAYATAEMAPAAAAEFRVLDRRPSGPDRPSEIAAPGRAVLDELLGQLAELVAEKIADRLMEPRTAASDEWLDTRRAAEYLGIHRDSLRRLAAEGAIPAEQASAGCKLYFRTSHLDAWRCPGSGSLVALRGGRHD